MTKSQAAIAQRDFMLKINQQHEQVGESLTLTEFWKLHYWDESKEEVLDELRTKRASTQRDMKNAMRQILLPRFGDRRMDSIKTGEVQSYLIGLIGARKDGKVSRRTVLKLKTYLSSVFSAAIRLECGVTRNPVRAVKLPVEEFTNSTPVLDDLHAQQIAESLTDPRHKMMWNMNLWMGNRIGETRALRWRCIDWATGRVTVAESLFEGKSNKPKTKAGERAVVLIEAQLAELKNYKQKHYPQAGPDDWVFPGKRNRPLDAGYVMTKTIKPIASKLGCPEIHWHALRHWNVSAMLNSGVDPAVRMKRVGHASVRTNLIYSHVDDSLQRAASEVIWQRAELAKQQLQQQQKAEP
jgi:integrase